MSRPVTLITGASAGLGVDFARQLAARGQRLVLAARRKERLDALAAELGNARTVAIDLSEAGATQRLIADIEAAGEHVDWLINNAGFGLVGSVARLNAARQRQMIDLNCGAVTDLCRLVVPGMIERMRGAILNVASTAAFQAGPGMAVYFATKAYVLSFTEALHEELKSHGIKVSCLCPGPTRTEFGGVAGFRPGPNLDRLTMDSAPVVAASLRALDRNKAIAITGPGNRLLVQANRIVPRSLSRRIAALLKSV